MRPATVISATVIAAIAVYLYIIRRKKNFEYIKIARKNNIIPISDCIPITNKNVTTYSRLTNEIIEYIKSLNRPIIEMYAGSGEIAKQLREREIIVKSFDLFTNDVVEYGVAGTLEDQYSDHILMILNGTSPEKSIDKYEGDIIILGGFGKFCNIKTTYIDLIKPNNLNIIEILEINSKINNSIEYDKIHITMRPDARTMSKKFNLIKTFLAKLEVDNWYNSFYVYQVWERHIE